MVDRLISKDGKSGAIPELVTRIRATGARVVFSGYLRNPGLYTPVRSCKPFGDELDRRLARMDAADPGFCMVETDRMGTQALLARLTGLLDGAGWVIPRLVTVEGCPALDLGTGVTVAPTSAGQDPLCSAQENAALRFQAKN